MTRRPNTAAAFAAAFALQGCVALSYGSLSSVPEVGRTVALADPGEIDWYGIQRPVALATPDAIVRIWALNEDVVLTIWGIVVPFLPLPGGSSQSRSYSRMQRQPPVFLIAVSIEPATAGVTFDPSATRLEIAPQEALEPAAAWMGRSTWACQRLTPGSIELPEIALDSPPHAIGAGSKRCFTLRFERSPTHPRVPFDLVFDGLRKNGSALLPRLGFRQRSDWTFTLTDVQ